MGKKRIIKKEGGSTKGNNASSSRAPKKKIASATLHVEASFNNTKAVVTDKTGNAIFSSSAGALGFRGAKKGTPFAASKVGEVLGEKSSALGIKEVDVIVKGVGSGREPTIRAFMTHNIEISAIRDRTPVPHNGPKKKKPRRV